MDIVISNASNKPIYEQISLQIKEAILRGDLAEGERLPSIRGLANDLRVSVITTKRAYSDLEAEGLLESVQGKGFFVCGGNREMLREGRLREIEGLLGRAVALAGDAGIARDDLHEMLDLLADESL